MFVAVMGKEERRKLGDCDVSDINDCLPAIKDSVPPTPKCCDELKQNIDCFNDYRLVYPNLGYVYAACTIS